MIEILVEGMTKNKGGKESYIINLFNAFDKERFHFSFIAYDDQIAYEDYLTDNSADVLHLPARSKGLRAFRRSIDRLFSEKQVDVLWAHKTTLSSCETLEYAKKHSVPLRIIHSHSSSNMGGILTYGLHTANKKLLRNWANAFFACSKPAGEWFYGNRPYTLIKNGIDIEKFRFHPEIRAKIRDTLNMNDRFVIGHVGRFGVEKNHRKLIRIFHEVCKKRQDARLVLCGDGEERENIEKQIRELGLEDRVILLGVISNVNEVLQAMDLLVMPSFFEGLPFALLEAQASGLRCVVSDTVSSESDVLGNTVFLPLDAEDDVWADCLLHAPACDDDRAHSADSMKSKGYDINDCAKKVEMIIDQGCRDCPPRRQTML